MLRLQHLRMEARLKISRVSVGKEVSRGKMRYRSSAYKDRAASESSTERKGREEWRGAAKLTPRPSSSIRRRHTHPTPCL